MRRIAAITLNPVVIALAATLALAGCASKNGIPNSAADLGLGANAATPGSAQDFTVNVGDRIFFDTDSSAIRADAQATLTRQAQWLKQYGNYPITIEGHADERGTREYNLALGARRAAATRDFLVARGIAAIAHPHHLLRQGTAGGGMRRPVLLVAEPPRRDRDPGRRKLTAGLRRRPRGAFRHPGARRIQNLAELSRPDRFAMRKRCFPRRGRSGENPMRLTPILGAIALLPVAFSGASGSQDQDVSALVDMGRAQLALRVPQPKIRQPGPRDAVAQPLLVAQDATADARVTQLEEQVRDLNGRIEDLNFQLLQLQEQIRKMKDDDEFRFQQLEKQHGDAGAAATGRQTDTASDSSTQQRLGEPPRSLGTLTLDQSGNVVGGKVGPAQQADNGLPGVRTGPAVAVPADNTTVAALPPTDDPDELYDDSYQFILSGDYGTAEAGFKQHIQRFPDDPHAADAHFWLGEALLDQQKYRDAAQVFLTASRDYPDSAKAPEMMLKLGVSLNAIDQRDVACATFSEAERRYPQASAAVRQRLKQEEANAKC